MAQHATFLFEGSAHLTTANYHTIIALDPDTDFGTITDGYNFIIHLEVRCAWLNGTSSTRCGSGRALGWAMVEQDNGLQQGDSATAEISNGTDPKITDIVVVVEEVPTTINLKVQTTDTTAMDVYMWVTAHVYQA